MQIAFNNVNRPFKYLDAPPFRGFCRFRLAARLSLIHILLWGLYYGIFLVIEKYVLKSVLEKLPHLLRVLYTMLIVMIGWVFFFCSDLGSAATYLGTLFHMNGGPL